MKYFVIYAPTSNLGDDIQTLAGIKFLESKGITEYECLSRESLCEYKDKEGVLLMNGWFLHNPETFPPASGLKPWFLSFHVSSEKTSVVSDNIDYFKKHEPIGCRDLYTVELLESNGISAYFTGCMTLLFESDKPKKSNEFIVDVNSSCTYVPNVDFNKDDYPNAIEIEHEIPPDTALKERLIRAQNVLDLYETAKLVVTSRLHCALPCRGFGTRCIFIHKNYYRDRRFKGLEEVLNGHDEQHEKDAGESADIDRIRLIFEKSVLHD